MNKKNRSIVILTGAGISAESGIATFRASDGLWENHRIEEVATPEGFIKNPLLVHTFYNQRRTQLLSPSVTPNKAHYALAKLEQEFDGSVLIITQNIDDLHERAGSKNVIHMHGELLKSRCQSTDKVFDCKEDLSTDTLCVCCKQPGNLRPHIVWFGEEPLQMRNIYYAVEESTLFVAIGTSGHVYPAAGLVNSANQTGSTTVEINLEKSEVANAFDSGIYGKAGNILPMWVDDLLSNQ